MICIAPTLKEGGGMVLLQIDKNKEAAIAESIAQEYKNEIKI